MTISQVLLAIWVGWYVPWWAAVIFSSRTKVQLGKDAASPYRAISSIGVMLMFVATGTGASEFGRALTGQPLWSAPGAVQWVFAGLVVAGLGFCWWARLHLGRLWSGFVTLKEDHHVVDTGPYGLVRHPIYTGVIFSALMTALAEATAASMLGAILVAAGFWGVARTEERFLREHLGAESYDDYARRVPMLVPGLR